MRIKLVAMLAVMAVVFISTELTVKGQPTPPPTVGSVFYRIVGRNPTKQELDFWHAQQPATNKTDFTHVAYQIMDWFVAPAQAGERLAAIDNAYSFYFKRAASPDERTKVEVLVRSKRIAAQDIGSVIAVDLVITKVEDAPGDPKALTVTVSNLSTISTSRRTTVDLVVYKEPRCHPWTDEQQLAAPVAKFAIAALAPQQSTTVKVTSTQVLQQANSQRGAYILVANGYGENFETNWNNNERCITGIGVRVVRDKVVDQKPILLFPRKLPTVIAVPPTPHKP